MIWCLEHFNGPQTKFIGDSLYKHPVSALISQFKQKQFYEILNDLHKTHFGVEQQVIQLEISAELYVPSHILFWTKCT